MLYKKRALPLHTSVVVVFFMILRLTNQEFRLPLRRKPTVSTWLSKRDFIAENHDYY